jgi:hypothetical protein
MNSRLELVGIKQVIRLEWVEKATKLLLAGIDEKRIRAELHDYLMERTGSRSDMQRGTTSRTQVVNMLMRIWVSPHNELIAFRNEALAQLHANPAMAMPIHWAMVSAAYPFWFNVSRQVGRITGLQNQVTHSQLVGRLKERYGDRETVGRYARATIRSMIAWGVMQDSEAKGCYEKTSVLKVEDTRIVALLIESILLAIPEGKAPFGVLAGSPSLFPFQISNISAAEVSRANTRIDVHHFGPDDDLLILKGQR